jgi:hypothetical protein
MNLALEFEDAIGSANRSGIDGPALRWWRTEISQDSIICQR